ncbi:MAG TPA: hypothetical protein VGF48_16460 [Thermoanaerobaculia bacterium]
MSDERGAAKPFIAHRSSFIACSVSLFSAGDGLLDHLFVIRQRSIDE